MMRKTMLLFLGILLLIFTEACASRSENPSTSTLPPANTKTNTWEGLPIFPDAVESQGEYIGYRYTIANADLLTVRRFYEDKMPAAGWNQLEIADVTTSKTGKAWSLLFTKEQTIVQVDIFTKDGLIHVVLHFA